MEDRASRIKIQKWIICCLTTNTAAKQKFIQVGNEGQQFLLAFAISKHAWNRTTKQLNLTTWHENKNIAKQFWK